MLILLLIGIWIAYVLICSDKQGTEKYIWSFITVVVPLALYFFALNPYLDKKERRKQNEKKEKELVEQKKEKEAETEIANRIIKFYSNSKYNISDYNDEINNANNGIYNYICKYCSIESNVISLDDFESKVLLDNIEMISPSKYKGKGILLELYNMKVDINYREIEYEDDYYGCYGTQEYLVSSVSFNGKAKGFIPLYENFIEEYNDTQSHLEYHDRIYIYEPNVLKIVLDKLGKEYEVLFDKDYIKEYQSQE